MKKSLIALLLVVALVVTVSVFAVSAETTNPFEGQTGDVVAMCPACGTEQTWKAVTAANGGSTVQNWPGASTGSTHFYYAEDITCTSGTTLTTEKFCINLNGKTITRAKATGSTALRFFTINGTDADNVPVLNLMDTSVDESGKMVIPMSGEGFFQVDYRSEYGTVNVYSGTYYGSGVEGGTSTSSGTLINCLALTHKENGKTITDDRGGTAHFNFYGGTLKGASQYSCGMLNLKEGTTVTIDGADLDGKCGGGTGGVCVLNHNAKLYLKSGSLTGGLFGTAAGWGSTIKLFDTTRFEMSGGTLTGGTNGGSKTARYFGGGIYAEGSATALISGGKITDCVAKDSNGGSIYWNSTGTLEMTGGEIANGKAQRVTSGNGGGSGGNVYIAKGTFNMSGGKITNDGTTQSTHCGNLYLGAGTVANITGGEITGGTTSNYGGNIYSYGAQLTIDAAEGKTVKITDGKGTAGGNIYVREGSSHTTAFTKITGPDVTITKGSDGGKRYMEAAAADSTANQGGSQIMAYGASGNPCVIELKDVNVNYSTTYKPASGSSYSLVNTTQFTLYHYGELEIDGNSKVSCAYIAGSNTGKVTVKEGFTGELLTRWVDATATGKVVAGGTLASNLTAEAGYKNGGTVKGVDGSRSSKTASWDGTNFIIAAFGGFNWDADAEEFVETPLATMPTEAGKYEFVRPYFNDPITLGCDTVLDVNNGVYTVTTGNYKLGLIETRSNDFQDYKAAGSTDLMNGNVTVDNTANLQDVVQLSNGYQYITIPYSDTSYTARRIQVDIDSVSIKPATAGIYYNVNINAAPSVAQYIDTYGVALDLVAMPNANFKNCDTTLYTLDTFEAVEGEQVALEGVRSALLTGILPTTDFNGTPSGEAPIYANAYVALTIGGKEVIVMADNPVDYSLMDIMQMIDANEELATNAFVIGMYKKFIDDMSGWKLENIAAAAAAAA